MLRVALCECCECYELRVVASCEHCELRVVASCELLRAASVAIVVSCELRVANVANVASVASCELCVASCELCVASCCELRML